MKIIEENIYWLIEILPNVHWVVAQNELEGDYTDSNQPSRRYPKFEQD